VSDLALWTSVLGGPIAFLLNLQVNYTMVDWACNTGHDAGLHLAHLVSLVLAVAVGWLGLTLWRRIGGVPDSGGGSESRSRFLAALGTFAGALSALAIFAQWITVMVLGSCLRA
jgi:hypothetical protein